MEGDDRPGARAGLEATTALLSELEEPKPGATGFWARLSVRRRALARLGIAVLCFAALSALHALLLWIYGTGGMQAAVPRDLFKLGIAVFLFGGVYLFIWGLAGLIAGRDWNALPGAVRMALLVLLTPLVVAPALALVIFPGAPLDMVRHAEWFKSLSPGYPEIKQHVEAIEAIRYACAHSEELDCFCHHREDMNREVDAVEALVAAHPDQAGFEILLPDPDEHRPNLYVSYSLDEVRRRRDPDSRPCLSLDGSSP